MYDESVGAIRRHLVRRGGDHRCSNCTYVASWNYRTGTYKETMDHLACFLPGMLALGAHGHTRDADMVSSHRSLPPLIAATHQIHPLLMMALMTS